MIGWNTALDSKYDVPVQNASIAVPFKDWVICYQMCQQDRGDAIGELQLTGRTVTKIVASKATISEMIERLIMMIHSFLSGFHSSSAGKPSFSRSIMVEFAEDSILSGISVSLPGLDAVSGIAPGMTSTLPGRCRVLVDASMGDTGELSRTTIVSALVLPEVI